MACLSKPVWYLVLAGLLALGTAGPAAAQAIDSLTADRAVAIALRQNPSVQATASGVQTAAADVRTLRSTWFPTVQSRAAYQRLSDIPDLTVQVPDFTGGTDTFTFANALLNRYSVQVGAEQVLFSGFRRTHRIRAAQARTAAARAALDESRADLAFRVRTAYWQLHEARAQMRATAQAVRLLEREHTDARNRRAAGMAVDADVLAVAARLADVRLQHLQAQQAVARFELDLNTAMHRAPDRRVVPVDSVVVRLPDGDLTAMIRTARARNPGLQALRREARARGEDVAAARSGWSPIVTARADYLYANPNERIFPPEDAFQGTWEAGVAVTWNLSLGGRTLAETDRAQARRAEQRHRVADAEAQVAAEVRRQHLAVVQAAASAQAARAAADAARAALQAEQSRVREGLSPIVALLNAEHTLRRAELRQAQATAQWAIARAGLMRVVGTRDG